MQAARGTRQGFDDQVHVPQAAVCQFGPHHRRCCPAGSLGRVGQIKQSVLGKGRMQTDVEQAALTAGIDLGHAGKRRAFQPSIGEDAQAAGPL